MSESDDQQPSQPSHYFYKVSQRRDGKTFQNYLGGGFQNKTGLGTEVKFDSVPIDGRMTMYTAEERLEMLKQQKQAGAAKGRDKQTQREPDQER